MIKNYLLITFRGMMKNKVFLVINVAGMGIAIACSIVAFLAYEYDYAFDSTHQQRASIYRMSSVRSFNNTNQRFGHVPFPLGEAAAATIAGIDKSTHYLQSDSNFKLGDDIFASNLVYVDPDFFDMFSWEFIAGDASAITDLRSVLISELVATRLFRSPQEALGKTITQVYGENTKEIKVVGVFREPPANSSFYRRNGSAYMNRLNYVDEHAGFREDDWKRESTVFVQVRDEEAVAPIKIQLQSYIANNNRVREDFQVAEFVLDPFSTMAHRDRTDQVKALTWGAPPISAITGSVVMAALLLLIACFNLTNTAIAISARRLKEIGIRKVMGSRRVQLIVQFIGETTFICFLALLAGLGMADLLIEGWNITTANSIHLSSHYLDAPAFLIFLCGLLLLTGLMAGGYPAFYISRFEPVNVLKGKLKFGGTNYFTRILLGLQFAFSLVAIMNGIAFMQNARYQRDYDLGFNIRGAVVTSIKDQHEFDTYRHALEQDPTIHSIAGARSGVFSTRVEEPVKFESRQAAVEVIAVGDQYLSTMGITLVEGRDFRRDSETDQQHSIIITQKMASLFGWDKPLGKEVIGIDNTPLTVIGVIKDVYTNGLWNEVQPMMIRFVLPAQYTQLIVSAPATRVSDVNRSMAEQWGKVFPNRLYNGHMLVSDLNTVVNLNVSIMYVYMFLGAVALWLSATGLFKVVSLNIISRMKEIGVRKLLGASVFNISRIINLEFVIILALASVLGSWMSFNMSNMIMSSIWKYYQGVNATTFTAALGLLFTISFATIAFKIFSVAGMNPVKTLKDD